MDTKKLGFIGIIIAVIMITGTVGYVYMGSGGNSPYVPDETNGDDVIGSSMEEDEESIAVEIVEEIDSETILNEDNSITLNVDGLGEFTLNPESEGILVIKDYDTSIKKTVTLDGEPISFNNGYYAEVMPIGKYVIDAYPNDEVSYKSFTKQVSVTASGINAGDGQVYIIVLEEIVDEGDVDTGDVDTGVIGEDPAESPATEGDNEPSGDAPVETRTLTVKVIESDTNNPIANEIVKIGTDVFKKTDSNGDITPVEISTTNAYWINVYGNDAYEVVNFQIDAGTSDVSRTVKLDKTNGIPEGWVPFKIRAKSTVDYNYAGDAAVAEGVSMYFKTSGDYIYDANTKQKVNQVSITTDSGGYSPSGRYYVPETGVAITIDTVDHDLGKGIDRVIDSSSDKNQYVWTVKYCPTRVVLKYKLYTSEGITGGGNTYTWWLMSCQDTRINYVSNIFNEAALWFKAAVYGDASASGDIYSSTDGVHWTRECALIDGATVYPEIAYTVPKTGTGKLYLKVVYDVYGDNVVYNDIKLWEISIGSDGYLDIVYKGLQ